MSTVAPLVYRLIVNVAVRLGQECHEALFKTKPQRHLRVRTLLCTPRTPKIELSFFTMQLANRGHNSPALEFA